MITENQPEVNAYSDFAHPPQVEDTQTFLDILHRGAPERFIQDLNAGPNHDKRRSVYYRRDEPVTLPEAWHNEHSNIFHGVNPVIVRREYYQAGHNKDVGALNTLYREYDAKDLTDPTQTEIDAQFEALRSNPDKAKSTDNALRNEALGMAKDAKYKSNPDHYKALVKAHVEQLNPALSVVVFSGGGYQCYWLLAESLIIRTHPDEPNAHIESYAADLQKRWVQLDPQADQGVHDLRRILRTPGTYNHKKKYAPDYPQVTFYQKRFDLRYSLQGLKALLPAPVAQPSQKTNQPVIATQGAPYEGPSVINAYNAANSITDILATYGYTHQAGRMMRPGGEQSGVDIDRANNRSRHWSSNDPLYSVFWRRPFDVFCTYAHEGDVTAAVRAAAAALGMAKARPSAALTPSVMPIINALRLWNKTRNLAERLPAGPGRKKVRPVLDGVFDEMQEAGALTVTIGKKRIARRANVSANTVKNVMARVDGNVFDVKPTEFGYQITLLSDCRLQEFDPSFLLRTCLTTGGQKTANDKNEYSQHKADDAFASGVSRHMKQRIKALAQALDITYKEARKSYSLKSLGEGVLLARDTWLRIGDYTAQEYAEEVGIKLSAARGPLRYAEQMGLAIVEREGSRGQKVYSFDTDFWEKVEELTPNLRTYKLSDQRENKRLEAAQQWAKHKEKLARTPEEKLPFQRKVAKLARRRLPHLASLYPDLSQAALERLAYDVAAYKRSPPIEQAIRTQRNQARAEHRDDVTMIRQLAESIADIGTPLENVFDEVMKYEVFDPRMVRNVLQSPAQMARYETLEDIRRRLHSAAMKLPAPTINTAPIHSHNQMVWASAA